MVFRILHPNLTSTLWDASRSPQLASLSPGWPCIGGTSSPPCCACCSPMRRTTSVSQHVIVLGCYDSAVACPRSRARAERPFVAVSAPSAIDAHGDSPASYRRRRCVRGVGLGQAMGHSSLTSDRPPGRSGSMHAGSSTLVAGDLSPVCSPSPQRGDELEDVPALSALQAPRSRRSPRILPRIAVDAALSGRDTHGSPYPTSAPGSSAPARLALRVSCCRLGTRLVVAFRLLSSVRRIPSGCLDATPSTRGKPRRAPSVARP